MKAKLYKFLLVLMVSMSLGLGPIAQNEIRKMLEALSGTSDAQVQELDEEEKESEEMRKRKGFPNYFQDSLRQILCNSVGLRADHDLWQADVNELLRCQEGVWRYKNGSREMGLMLAKRYDSAEYIILSDINNKRRYGEQRTVGGVCTITIITDI